MMNFYGAINSKGEGSNLTEKEYISYFIDANNFEFKTNKYLKDLDISDIINRNID